MFPPLVGILCSEFGASFVKRSLEALRILLILTLFARVVGCISEYLLERLAVLLLVVIATVEATLEEQRVPLTDTVAPSLERAAPSSKVLLGWAIADKCRPLTELWHGSIPSPKLVLCR